MRDLDEVYRTLLGIARATVLLNGFESQYLASGKPHLFLCQQRSVILRRETSDMVAFALKQRHQAQRNSEHHRPPPQQQISKLVN